MTRDFEPSRGVPGVNEASLLPTQVKERIRSLHPLDRDTIDRLIFGKPCTEFAREMLPKDEDYDTLKARYAGEIPWRGLSESTWTPYDKIRRFIEELGLSSDTTLYDLGAGYGRVPLYAGILIDATCKGIELVPERAERAQAAKDGLQLDNVEIINANVLDVDFSDGDVFYLYNPFSAETFNQVLARLQQVAKKKPITLVARATYFRYDSLKGFMRTKSLNISHVGYNEPDIEIYTSRLHPHA